MNILVTGDAGFIGQHLTGRLLDQGHAVIGIDICRKNPVTPLYRLLDGNICDGGLMEKSLKGVDLIIHLAAKHHDFGISREEYFAVNEGGTKNILRAASRACVKKLLFFSSVAVYGKFEADDQTAPSPVNDYGESKLAAEKAIGDWVQQDDSRSAVIVRPVIVFGTNNFANMYNLIDKVVRKRFYWVGEGGNVKSVAYVENVVDATLFLLARMKPGFETYNYSDEPHLTVRRVVQAIAKYGNVPAPRLKIPFYLAETGGRIMDFAAKRTGINFPITGARINKFNSQTFFRSEKLRQLGWKQPVSLEDGFKRTVSWYLQHNRTRANHPNLSK
jgi:nucleoside-diphosphate-sugar epimerase